MGDNRLNGVKVDNSLMYRPRPSNTNFGESLLYYSVLLLTLPEENSCTWLYNKTTVPRMTFKTLSGYFRDIQYYRTFYGNKLISNNVAHAQAVSSKTLSGYFRDIQYYRTFYGNKLISNNVAHAQAVSSRPSLQRRLVKEANTDKNCTTVLLMIWPLLKGVEGSKVIN